MIKLQYGFLRLGYFVTGRYRTTIQSVPRGGSNCSIRVRTAILGVPRGEGGGSSSSSSSRVRVNPGGFELFDTSLNWLRTSASEGMGGGKFEFEFEFEFEVGSFFFLAGGGVRVRVRGFELSSLEGRGGEEFEFEFEVGRFAFRWGGGELEFEFEFEGSKCYYPIDRIRQNPIYSRILTIS